MHVQEWWYHVHVYVNCFWGIPHFTPIDCLQEEEYGRDFQGILLTHFCRMVKYSNTILTLLAATIGVKLMVFTDRLYSVVVSLTCMVQLYISLTDTNHLLCIKLR